MLKGSLVKFGFMGLVTVAGFACAPRTGVKTAFPALPPFNSPVIIIPGMMGTQLVDPVTQAVVWGKVLDLKGLNPHEALIRPDQDGLELPIDARPIQANRDRLVPTSLLTSYKMINRILEVKVYKGLIDAFAHQGCQLGDIEHCTASDNLFLFPYDWRRDLVEGAMLLGERIAAIQSVNQDPDLKVTLIAHSLGGVIAKYYMMYGTKDVITGVIDGDHLPEPDYSGARNIDKLFLLGTPNRGSYKAFKALNEGEYIMPFVTTSRWVTFTMPSLYQILPLDTESMFIDDEGNPVALDIFDIETWMKYGIGLFDDVEWASFEQQCAVLLPDQAPELAHARRLDFKDFIEAGLKRGKLFQQALAKMDWGRVETEHYIIAGNCDPTLSGFRFRVLKSGKTNIRAVKRKLFREHYYFTDKGDKIVLYSDQAPEMDSADEVLIDCLEHRTMPGNPKVQQMIMRNLQAQR